MKRQKGIIYADVVVKMLTDSEATREAIGEGLDWLKGAATQHDVAMIFFSGHGVNDADNTFLFRPDRYQN